MSHKWPDLSDYNLKILFVELNGKRKVGFFPLGSAVKTSVSAEVEKNLLNNFYYSVKIDNILCYLKDDDSLTVSDICKIIPEYYQSKKVFEVGSLDDVLLDNPKISFSEEQNEDKYSLEEFEEFMKTEYTPKNIREMHLECVSALIDCFSESEIKSINSTREIKEIFNNRGGDPSLVKRKRIECAFPFYKEYMRLKDNNALLNSKKVSDSEINAVIDLLNKTVEEHISAENINRPSDFINLYQRNLFISGAKTMLDYLGSVDIIKDNKIIKNLFKGKFGSSHIIPEDLRFFLLTDKQRIHYKSPVLTSLEKYSGELNQAISSIVEQRLEDIREHNYSSLSSSM